MNSTNTEQALEDVEFEEQQIRTNETDEYELEEEILKNLNITSDVTKDKIENIINDIYSDTSKELDIYGFKIKLNNLNFGECEDILRKKYDVSNSSKINFISADLGNGKIEYAPYNEEKGFLDMSYCKGVKIKQIIDLKNETNLDLSAISKYMSKGIDSLNVNDRSFFQ